MTIDPEMMNKYLAESAQTIAALKPVEARLNAANLRLSEVTQAMTDPSHIDEDVLASALRELKEAAQAVTTVVREHKKLVATGRIAVGVPLTHYSENADN